MECKQRKEIKVAKLGTSKKETAKQSNLLVHVCLDPKAEGSNPNPPFKKLVSYIKKKHCIIVIIFFLL